MSRALSVAAVVTLSVLLPVSSMAGGPAWLSLPIEGVTKDKMDTYSQQLASKLKSQVHQFDGKSPHVWFQERSGQWNVMFYLSNDVTLRDVESALAGSGLSIARERLHLFGHVILEMDGVDQASAKKLVSELEGLEFVSVESSQQKENRLFVTVDMPYPTQIGRPHAPPVSWSTFQRNGLASDQSTKTEGSATAKMLPTYQTFHDLVAKHNARLNDIRWSVNFHCRPLGGVGAPVANRTAKTTRSTNR